MDSCDPRDLKKIYFSTLLLLWKFPKFISYFENKRDRFMFVGISLFLSFACSFAKRESYKKDQTQRCVVLAMQSKNLK